MRQVTPVDLPEIAKLSADLQAGSTVMEDVQRYMQAMRDPLEEGGTPISVLVARCADQVVGVAVMRNEKVSKEVSTRTCYLYLPSAGQWAI